MTFRMMMLTTAAAVTLAMPAVAQDAAPAPATTTEAVTEQVVAPAVEGAVEAVVAPAPESAEPQKAPKKLTKDDTDADGFISKDEFLARYVERFNEIDADKDGKISREEREAYKAAMKAKAEEHKGHEGPMGQGEPQDEEKKSFLKRFFD